jgi:mannose-P-dolichol utilization defect protein 1
MDDVLVFVSRCLSYSVIFLSIFMKVPQILALYSSGSSRGISARAYWLEILCYEIGVAYGYFYDIHVTTYGEAILLALQSHMIVYLTVKYSGDWSLENGAWLVANGAFIAAIVTKSIPASIISLLLAATVPLMIASRGTQIYGLYRLKSIGDVSISMFALSAYACAARLFTIAVEVKDLQIFFTFVLSFCLNLTVVVQCFYYGRSASSHHQKKTK